METTFVGKGDDPAAERFELSVLTREEALQREGHEWTFGA
jgi:hypothetical protein